MYFSKSYIRKHSFNTFLLTVPAEPTASFRGVSKYSFYFKWGLVKGATTYSYNCQHKESGSQVGIGTTAGNEIFITSLQIQTEYVCYVHAGNEAGSSNEVSATVKTGDFSYLVYV